MSAGIRGFAQAGWAALRRRGVTVVLVGLLLSASAYLVVAQQLPGRPPSPVIVVETTQGTFAIETYPREAPTSVAHITKLAKEGFYDGQRVHRAVPHFVVQFGDPQTRDLAKRAVWGKGSEASSGNPVGIAEVTLSRSNVALAVGLAHMGEPARADSQLYILLEARPELDGQYAVIGQVVEGADVPAKLGVGDQIRRAYIRE